MYGVCVCECECVCGVVSAGVSDTLVQFLIVVN